MVFYLFQQVILTLGNSIFKNQRPAHQSLNLTFHKLVFRNFSPALNTPTCLAPFPSFAYFLDVTSVSFLFYFCNSKLLFNYVDHKNMAQFILKFFFSPFCNLAFLNDKFALFFTS